jgi:hypothetical protein
LFYFVMQASTPRQEGGSVTGNTPVMQQQPAAPQQNPIVTQLEAAVQKDPNNLALRNDLAQAYLETDNLMAVFEQTKFVLIARHKIAARSRSRPGAWRWRRRGRDEDAAAGDEERSENLDSWVSLAWVYVQQNKVDDAEKMIAAAKKQSPDEAARLDSVFSQMKAQMSGAPAQITASNELPADIHRSTVRRPRRLPGAGCASRRRPMADPSASRWSSIRPLRRERRPLRHGCNPMGGPPVASSACRSRHFGHLQLRIGRSMMGQPLPTSSARPASTATATRRPNLDRPGRRRTTCARTSVKLALK